MGVERGTHRLLEIGVDDKGKNPPMSLRLRGTDIHDHGLFCYGVEGALPCSVGASTGWYWTGLGAVASGVVLPVRYRSTARCIRSPSVSITRFAAAAGQGSITWAALFT